MAEDLKQTTKFGMLLYMSLSFSALRAAILCHFPSVSLLFGPTTPVATGGLREPEFDYQLQYARPLLHTTYIFARKWP